jgi:hypothetical protein
MDVPVIFDALKYGTIGLSAILTLFSYLLLSKEQGKPDPRPHILTEIRIFMAFALVSLSVGMFSQLPIFRPLNWEPTKEPTNTETKKQPEAVWNSDLKRDYFATTWIIDQAEDQNFEGYKARYKYAGTLTGTTEGSDVILTSDMKTIYAKTNIVRGRAIFSARGPISNNPVAAYFTYTREGVNGFGTAFMEFDNSGHAYLYLVNRVTSTQKGEGDIGAAKFHITKSDASQ